MGWQRPRAEWVEHKGKKVGFVEHKGLVCWVEHKGKTKLKTFFNTEVKDVGFVENKGLVCWVEHKGNTKLKTFFNTKVKMLVLLNTKVWFVE